MIGEKVKQFQNKNTDLGGLQSKIEEYLKSDGFTTSTSAPSSTGRSSRRRKVASCAGSSMQIVP